MQKYIDFLKERIGKEKLLKIAFISGIAGMMIILVSDFFPFEKPAGEKNGYIDISSYKNELQEEVEGMLEKIDGVGRVEVMITFSGTEEYIFAEEIKASKSDKFNSQMQNEFVLIEKNGEKEALISKVNNPEISGVVVVCDGGDSDKVCESVYRTVSTVLGIPTKNIYVTKLK